MYWPEFGVIVGDVVFKDVPAVSWFPTGIFENEDPSVFGYFKQK